MRAVKALLVAFFIITLVTGYIIYNSGMSISISFKNPSWNKTGDQDIETGTAGHPEMRRGRRGGPDSGTGTVEPTDTVDTESAAGSALPVVRRVHELFQSRREDDEKSFREIIDLLPGIDWSLYAKEYDAAGAKEVLEWISQSPYTAEGENVLNIFKATKGLDGVLSDQYGVIVGEFFRNDTDKYVKLLARLDRQSIDRVCRFTANNNYYHVEPEEAVESITARFEGRDLTDSERYVVDSMLKAIKAYITEKST
jgi:hypothetical protein